MKHKLLIVVDMQNDFIDGSLGTPEAQKIVPAVVEKIRGWDGDVVCTADTHGKDYLSTNEGRHLPVEHCIVNTDGWRIHPDVRAALGKTRIFLKPTFASVALGRYLAASSYDHIELVGLCTDVCVISNALLVKGEKPEADVVVDSACCAGVTPYNHRTALDAMKACQIEIV